MDNCRDMYVLNYSLSQFDERFDSFLEFKYIYINIF